MSTHLFKFLKILFFLILGNQAFSQISISGTVTDTTGSPLPFVTVQINGEPGRGVITDIEGRFIIEGPRVDSLVFRSVGYTRAKVVLKAGRASEPLRIVLRAAEYGLPEATIVAGENPADIIIRRAIANRNRNNPEKRDAYRCQTYNKVIIDPLPDRSKFEEKYANRDTSKESMKEIREKFEKIDRYAQIKHLFLMESATERSYRLPGQVQEKVLLNRVSGFQQSGLVVLANAIQPFTFYNDYINILDKSFVNPISPNSPDLYFFHIADTLFDGGDTIWVIPFHPRQGKVFQGLQGVLHIHSNGWAVRHVSAKPDQIMGNLDMQVEQVYQKVQDSLSASASWFPEQLRFELTLFRYPAEYFGIRVSGLTYVSQVELQPELENRDFIATMPLYMLPGAHSKSDTLWQVFRQNAPLTEKDFNTYRHLDSLGEKKSFQRVSNLLNILTTGYWPVRQGLSIDIRRFVRFNDFEQVRLGIGLSTAHGRPLELPNRLEAGAYFGYGLADQAIKYGGYGLWRIGRSFSQYFRVEASRDLQEPGALFEHTPSAFATRSLYARRMDYVNSVAASFWSRLWKGAEMRMTVRQEYHEPGFEYQFFPINETARTVFSLTEATVFFRYAYGEKTEELIGNPAWRINRLPVLEMAFTSGIFEPGNYYRRWAAALYQTIFIRRLGRLNWRLEGGYVTPGTPLPRLFTLNQPGSNTFNLFVVANTFQALPDTLFAADRFVNFYLAQEIGPVLYKTKRSSPFLILRQHLAWGDMAQKERQGIGFRTARRPLLESGVQLDDILRLNYVNFAYIGFGGAVFYRWGDLASSSSNWRENLVWRLTMRFSL